MIQFFKNALNFCKMYNNKLRKQLTEQKQISESGKGLLRQVVDEFNRLDAPTGTLCRLVDNDEKVIIKLLGVWVVIGIDVVSENLATLTIYGSKRWSTNWEEYTIPVDNTLRFDRLGNLRQGESPYSDPELFGFNILECVLNVGKNYTPSKLSTSC